MNKKNNAITLTRVISMIFIVLCHIIPYYDFIPGANALAGIFNVGIYSFLVISGYLYGDKEIINFKRWYLLRILKICLPASFFVTICLIIFVLCGQKVSLISMIIYVLNLGGLGSCVNAFYSLFSQIDAFAHLWFIFNIMMCYLLLPIFNQMKSYLTSKKAYLEIIIIALLVNYMLSTLINVTFIYIIAFFVGFGLKDKFNDVLTKNKWYLSLNLLMVVMQGLRVVINLINFNPSAYASFSEISHLTLGLWLFVTMVYFERKLPQLFDFICCTPLVQWLDTNSFYIYIVHHVFSVSGSILCCYQIKNLAVATIVFILLTLASTYALSILVNTIHKHLIKQI